MSNKQIDWSNLGFGYIQTDKRYVSNFKDGAWDEGGLTEDANIVLNECAGVLQYAQTVFEGMKAYTTEDGHIVTYQKCRGRKKAVDTLAQLYETRVVDAGSQIVAISHGDCLEEAQALADKICAAAKPKELIFCPHEPVTGSHVGPGMLAVFFFGKGSGAVCSRHQRRHSFERLEVLIR